MAYIYILHFDTKLSHAEHYAGCTEKLEKRLIAHANGAGSHLTRVLKERQIEWRLGGLMVTTHAQMRRHERNLKDQGHAARYCEICNTVPKRLEGTTPYPITGLPFEAESTKLRTKCNTQMEAKVRFTTDKEPPGTIEQIKQLMKLDKDALGFIPAGGKQGLEALVPQGKILIAEIENDIVGYIAYTTNYQQNRLTIQQCCVKDEIRLQGLGRKMVYQIVKKWPDIDYEAKVRNDLAANHFWEAINFHKIGDMKHKTSGNILNHYRRDA
jgi:predicted GIY-YIG superfamily endonuclease/predicted GNAT family acetyltransferase